jgi:hypothetical protein
MRYVTLSPVGLQALIIAALLCAPSSFAQLWWQIDVDALSKLNFSPHHVAFSEFEPHVQKPGARVSHVYFTCELIKERAPGEATEIPYNVTADFYLTKWNTLSGGEDIHIGSLSRTGMVDGLGWWEFFVFIDEQNPGLKIPAATPEGFYNVILATRYELDGEFFATDETLFREKIFIGDHVASPVIAGHGGSVVPSLTHVVPYQSYTVSASPDPGFVFEGWSGPSQNAVRDLTFTLDREATVPFKANFRDVTPPQLTVVAPLPNSRFTNAALAITGTASDNDQVAVYASLNSGPWIAATGTTNWEAHVPWVTGKNTVRLMAEDPEGLHSKTNSLAVTFVPMAALDLTVSGPGRVSALTNGQFLEVGKVHTLAAIPSAGCAFAGWTGSTNKSVANLAFIMREGFHLAATFNDIAKPTLQILSPKPNETRTNSVITIAGRASDNRGVAKVFYQIDGGLWMEATGTTNWSANVTVSRASHSVRAYAVDTSGHASQTATVSFNVPPFEGIYFANISGIEFNAILIRPDYSATWIGGLSLPAYGEPWELPFQVANDGSFLLNQFAPPASGRLTATGLQLTLTTPANPKPKTNTLTFVRRSTTGFAVAHAGLYSGSVDNVESGSKEMYAIVSADGQVTFTIAHLGGGKGTLTANKTFTASALGASFAGKLDPSTQIITGAMRKASQVSTFTLRREAIAAAPLPLPLPQLTFEPAIAPHISIAQNQILFDTQSGHTYIIEASTDLRHWDSLATINSQGGEYAFDVPFDSMGREFYRIRVP